MKKFLLSLFSVIGFAVAANATGTLTIAPSNPTVPNPSQGPFTFTSTNQFTNVIQFPIQLGVIPAMIINGGITNQFTNVVTTTNFTISIGGGIGTTNVWTYSYYYPYQRIQVGSAITLATVPTNILFPIPYLIPPSMNVVGSITNTGTVAIQNVTTTGFTLLCNTLSTNMWQALGPCASAGINILSY